MGVQKYNFSGNLKIYFEINILPTLFLKRAAFEVRRIATGGGLHNAGTKPVSSGHLYPFKFDDQADFVCPTSTLKVFRDLQIVAVHKADVDGWR